jgi:hypothetical protein
MTRTVLTKRYNGALLPSAHVPHKNFPIAQSSRRKRLTIWTKHDHGIQALVESVAEGRALERIKIPNLNNETDISHGQRLAVGAEGKRFRRAILYDGGLFT